MKLKLLKDAVIAHQIVGRAHYRFQKDSVVDSTDAYLTDTLLKGGYAMEMNKSEEKVKVKQDQDSDPKPSKKKMFKDVVKNKMMKGHLNK